MSLSFTELGPDLKSTLYGEWLYKGSLINGRYKTIKTDIYLPVEKMVFKPCDDREELKTMSSAVKKMRKDNAFQNLQCTTYNSEQKIDVYFPVKASLNSRNNDILVHNYGRKFKQDYFIYKIYKDTLVVYNDDTISIGKKAYTTVKHLYVKTK